MVTPFINRNDVALKIANEIEMDAHRQIAGGIPDSRVNEVLWRMADELRIHDEVEGILQERSMDEVNEAMDNLRARWGHD